MMSPLEQSCTCRGCTYHFTYTPCLEMSASTDVESQSPAVRSRSRCLDTFLTVSVIALFLMFMVALAGALYFAKHIEDEINARTTRRLDGSADALVAPFPETGNAYKMQNFAYLRAIESKLKSGVMAWESIAYGKSRTIGSLYSYDKKQNVLNVNESGSYFLYVQLTFSCTEICPSGQFTVSFHNQRNSEELTCTVSLPKWSEETPISKTCWRVVTFPENRNRLFAKSQFNGTLDWKLELNDSGFGMFLVDGLPAVRHT
ncbi:uncharacterized protein LOC107719225 isoform X2 [Sinocyclocheilus rhinocerous]|uniref:uncharacterized protein LOC107719225 isoform X1 n=1 Tax=Sinocyclocheilus rhinocerous TaxID=307959 RepID=UPI0007B7C985|nr:PREDICTED: uncharacterized protein LOC107719225 isoform X1 [Sinocyclocheilus rhinocerous]XP_016382096.1 PREDICTED: uncharacterized protein LOC107719225 isoform X2 [Sinocyclocheilus rhinocerous]